jgi:hypothetical protein
MGLFKKRLKPLDPLVVRPFSASSDNGPQDDVPGPGSLDFEAIEHRQALKDADRGMTARSAGRLRSEAERFPSSERDAAIKND